MAVKPKVMRLRTRREGNICLRLLQLNLIAERLMDEKRKWKGRAITAAAFHAFLLARPRIIYFVFDGKLSDYRFKDQHEFYTEERDESFLFCFFHVLYRSLNLSRPQVARSSDNLGNSNIMPPSCPGLEGSMKQRCCMF